MDIQRTTTIDIYEEDGTTLIKSITKGITSGSLICEEILFESTLRFGQCCANRFEAEVNELDSSVAGKIIKVTQVQDDITIPIFKGRIDTSKKDNYSITRHIVAYDALYYKRDMDIAEWWTNFWKTHSRATIKQLRDSLCEYVEIEYIDIELMNDDLQVSAPFTVTSMTFGEMLKMLCEISCVFPHIDREGILDYISINMVLEPIDITGKYETGGAYFEEFTTAEITGIAVCDTPDNLLQANGEKGNRYYIAGNLFLMELDATTLNTVIDNMYDKIKDIAYCPCEIPLIVSDHNIKLGSIVTTPQGNILVNRLYFSGPMLLDETIASDAFGEYLEQTAPDVNGTIVQGRKISKLERTVDELSSTFIKVEVGGRNLILGSKDFSGSMFFAMAIITDESGNVLTDEDGYILVI